MSMAQTWNPMLGMAGLSKAEAFLMTMVAEPNLLAVPIQLRERYRCEQDGAPWMSLRLLLHMLVFG